MGLKGVVRFNLNESIPVNEETTYKEIAAQRGIPGRTVRRIIRHGMTDYPFHEPRKRVVAHTALTQ